MKSIVLTGATSMLGVALIKECIRLGTNVLAVIRPDSSNKYRLPESSLVQLLECDHKDLHKLPNLANGEFDCFYHFAWEGTDKAQRDDAFIQERNIAGTLYAAQAAKELGCKAFVGSGSQAEYGRADGLIAPGTRTNPENAYGIAKLVAGNLSRQYCGQHAVRFAWGRICSVYGEYDHSDTMIMYLIKTLLAGERPSLTKCGQMWDYLYCGDAADAFYRIGEKGNGIYCVGSGSMQPLKEYVEIISGLIDHKIDVGFGEKDYSHHQVMKLCADISSLKQDTGFAVKTDFTSGIKKTINWYKRENGL